MRSRSDILRLTVSAALSSAPVKISAATSIGEAADRMAQSGGAAVIVSDVRGRPVGIVTALDLLQRGALRTAADAPIETVMSAPVVTVSPADRLIDAVALMRRRSLSRLPVVEADGAVAGTLRLEDGLAALSALPMELVDQLSGGDTIEGLKRIKGLKPRLAKTLLGDHAPVVDVLAALSEIDADLHRRTLDLAIASMTSDGWGAPPIAFALIVMGSGGRGESLLAPDQDNGFILADHGEDDRARADGYFTPLAERFTRLLAAVGFPPCTGNVMASNAVWRKDLSAWRTQVSSWLRTREPDQLLLSDVLIDFRHVAGDASLSEALRAHLMHAIAKDRTFLNDLFSVEIDHGAALDWFGGLKSERDKQQRPGMINLKWRGMLPLVEAARLLSLKAGIAATGTIARLDALAAQRAINRDDHAELTETFRLLAGLLLRQQIEDIEAGQAASEFVPEARLSRRERDALIEGFRAIDRLRAMLRSELAGSPF